MTLNPSTPLNIADIPSIYIDLGVNIDHIATLRNVRGTSYPSPLMAAQLALFAGADLITLHLREDRRHIRDDDLWQIKASIQGRLNLECAVTAEMLDIACQVRPSDVCLVPERREELTTEGGLDVIRHRQAIAKAHTQLQDAGIRTSAFIDADFAQIDAVNHIGIPVIELHTGAYAQGQQSIEQLRLAANYAEKLGLKVHAGHGLHYQNVGAVAGIASITELNIGHAMVAHAIWYGWQQAVQEMKNLMLQVRAAALNL